MHFEMYTLHPKALLWCALRQRETLVATKLIGKFARLALWISPIIIVVAGGFPALGWATRRQHPALVQGIAIGIPLFVIAYSSVLAKRVERLRPLDEVQVAGQGYAHTRGWAWGTMLTVVLLMVPPVQAGLIDGINALVNTTGAPPSVANHLAMQIAIFGGISLLALAQWLCVLVVSAAWRRRMGGSGESHDV